MPRCATCQAPDHEAGSASCPAQLVGRTLVGKFTLTRLLGAGGMGAVYAAVQHPLEINVAIKTLLPGRHDTANVQRFFQEAQAAARIGHPGIVKVTDLDQDGDLVFLVMECLRGTDLQEVLDRGGKLPAGAALAVAYQALDALHCAHKEGIVHRDLKPSNLFLAEEKPDSARVKLLDFGLAKIALLDPESRLTGRELPGTALYVSHEQAERPADADARSDVYSMGVVLFELLTGQLPTTSFIHALAGRIERRPSRHCPDLAPGIDELVARALQFEPGDRFADAGAMREAVEAELRGLYGQDPRVVQQDLLYQLYQQIRPAAAEQPRPNPNVSFPGRRIEAVAPTLPPPPPSRSRAHLRRVLPAAALLLLGVGYLGYRLARPWMMPEHQMALLPGGSFTMGSRSFEIDAAHRWCERQHGAPCDRKLFEREQPARQVRLSPFLLDRTEVTFAKFAEWLNRQPGLQVKEGRLVQQEGVLLVDLYPYYEPTYPLKLVSGRYVVAPEFERGSTAQFERMPVTQVTWEGARRYCAAQGKRLPTEAEWEYAARGASGRRFPWGDQEPECGGVNFGRDAKLPCAALGVKPSVVASSWQDRTPEGVYDLAGNASEWVEDRFLERYPECGGECVDPRFDQRPSGPPGERAGADRQVFRGGNWNFVGAVSRGAARSQFPSGAVLPNVGFRCAKSR